MIMTLRQWVFFGRPRTNLRIDEFYSTCNTQRSLHVRTPKQASTVGIWAPIDLRGATLYRCHHSGHHSYIMFPSTRSRFAYSCKHCHSQSSANKRVANAERARASQHICFPMFYLASRSVNVAANHLQCNVVSCISQVACSFMSWFVLSLTLPTHRMHLTIAC